MHNVLSGLQVAEVIIHAKIASQAAVCTVTVEGFYHVVDKSCG